MVARKAHRPTLESSLTPQTTPARTIPSAPRNPPVAYRRVRRPARSCFSTPRSVRGPLAGRLLPPVKVASNRLHGRTARGTTHLHVEPRASVLGNRQSRIFRCSNCVSRSLTPDNREVVPKPDYCPVGAVQEIVEQHQATGVAVRLSVSGRRTGTVMHGAL